MNPKLAPHAVWPGARIGLYGGSFNPVHAGHAHVAHTALRRLGLDGVWVLVSPQNPLKKTVETAPYALRLRAARELLSGARVHVSDAEARLDAGYTIDTVQALRRLYPGVRFVLVMGADSFAGLHRWKEWSALARLVPIGVIARPGWSMRALLSPAARVLPRRAPFLLAGTPPPGWSYVVAPFHPQSSTAIRAGRWT